MGRPTKLTPDLLDALTRLLRRGWFVEHACAEVGISDTTFDRWMKEGAAEDAPEDKSAFRAACVRARARGERVHLKRAQDKSVSGGGWQLDVRILEALNPSRYRPQSRTEVSGPEGGPIEIQDAAARVASRIDRLAAASGAREGSSGSGTDEG